MPQDQVFRFQRCSCLEARSQDTENQLEQIGHQDASLRRPLAASTPNRIFGTHRFNGQKGYGFIQPDTGGKDVFVHISAVEKAGYDGLPDGAKVSYDIISDRGKESAGNLRLK